MTAPATIELVADRDRAGLNHTEYNLRYRGVDLPNVQVIRTVSDQTGEKSLWINAPKVDGKPVLNNSQMDAVARKLLTAPRAGSGTNGPLRMARRYYEQP